jgi:hypothetical protein
MYHTGMNIWIECEAADVAWSSVLRLSLICPLTGHTDLTLSQVLYGTDQD